MAGLEDRRGKRLANQIPRTPEEALRIENARLERENYLLKMELDLLKKVKELERGNHRDSFVRSVSMRRCVVLRRNRSIP